MSRSSWLLAGAVLTVPAIVFGVMSISGCGNDNLPTNRIPPGGDPAAGREPTIKKPDQPPADLKPALDGWTKPAAAIVLSGEQHGYLEPCGCTDTQSGGVSRRADLFRQMKEKGWEATGLDLGGVPKRARAQSLIKFDVMRAALKEMGYAAQGFGPDELRLDAGHLLAVGASTEPGQPAAFPFVCANVVLFDTPDLGTPLHQQIVKVGDVTIGVTAVLDPAVKNEIAAEGSALASTFKIEPMEEPLRKAVDALKGEKPDLLVLLSHCELPTTKKLIESFPEFDLVVSAGGPEDPDPKPVQAAKPLLVTVGHKGKSVGVVGYYPDAEPKLKYELVNLDKWRFHETPAMQEHMRAYQKRLKDEEIVAKELPLENSNGNTYVGAKKCGECHKKAYETWKTTKHAHAFESIDVGGEEYQKGEKKGTYISRVFDAECLACHSVGWNPQEMLRYKDGYMPPEFASDEATKAHMLALRGNQCENCHGPGSRHTELDEAWAKDRGQVKEEDVLAARKEVKLLLAEAKDKLCYKCHDNDNSPHFNATTFDLYWNKVKHPWRD